MKKSLNGVWEFKQTKAADWMPATVPGCNFLDLLALKKIPDPFLGTNEKDLAWVGEADWEYRRTFSLTKTEAACKKITLVCDMLDTVCNVYINETLIGGGENCHLQYRFNIKKAVQPGENTIRIVFRSPVQYVKEKYAVERCPDNNNGQNGIPHIRKPQCHFGWDWGPVLPPSGITKEIYLECADTAALEDLQVTQTHHNDGTVTVHASAQAKLYDKNADVHIEISLTEPDGTVHTVRNDDADFKITKPQLWWTAELSGKKEQPLYAVTARLLCKKEVLAETSRQIGLRTIILNQEKDQFGTNFQFILNGVPLFIKGTNWIPADSFINRFSQEKLEYQIDAVLFSNMNMIRVWGGGYYESDAFYDLCDRKGILVWQDFCFACQPYPFFDREFLENVKRETEYNVKRLRHHASLAIWCGNNEIETMSIAWIARKKYISWTEKFFYQILEPEIRKYDSATPYIPGSPCGISHNNGFDRDNVGDTHLWAVWHGLQPMNYYRKRMTRFCSEFGFESLPDLKTIERFAKKEDYSLTSEVFTAHQKCASGNMKMLYYIVSRFRLPKHFEDFIYLSQVTQQECIKDATEHWRRNKGRCNGAMYWQLNDCWPVCSWASMDYYGNYKALQYTARHFNAPVTVSIEDGKSVTRVFALNDTTKELSVTVRCSIFDFTTGVQCTKQKSFLLPALKNQSVFAFPMDKFAHRYDLEHTGLLAELLVDDAVIARKTVLFDPEKQLELPKAQLQKTVQIEKDQLIIKVSSDVFARLVRVESTCSTLPFSDNYFDLLPGEEQTITMPLDPSCTPEEWGRRRQGSHQ